MDPWEMKEDIKRMHEGLREQKERVTSSKKEAKKLLVKLGIWHLLVPIKKTGKSTPKKKASKTKSTGK
jgi:hypothetical protein